MASVMIVCGICCCPGCFRCSGQQIGCHQYPCRCGKPCDCKYDIEYDRHVSASGHCERHDDAEDRRCRGTIDGGGWMWRDHTGKTHRGHYAFPCSRIAKVGEHYCWQHRNQAEPEAR